VAEQGGEERRKNNYTQNLIFRWAYSAGAVRAEFHYVSKKN